MEEQTKKSTDNVETIDLSPKEDDKIVEKIDTEYNSFKFAITARDSSPINPAPKTFKEQLYFYKSGTSNKFYVNIDGTWFEIPTLSSTTTLTSKRITPRVGTTTSNATPTINTDLYDIYLITAQAVDITSMTTNLSGTPTSGQKLIIGITGTASRGITWGTSFEASTVALPSTTSSTARLDIEFIWNATTSKWRCIRVS